MSLVVRLGFILLLSFHQSYGIMRMKCMVHDDKTSHPERPRMQSQTTQNDVSPRGIVSTSKLCHEQYVVPVAWHVIVSKNGDGTVSDAQIWKSMEVLNGGFKDSRLYFRVHSIQRITNDDWNNECVREKSSFMKALAISPAKVLNVYTCTFDINEDIIVGNAALPWFFEQDSVYNGVVVHPGTLPEGNLAPLNHGKNLVHEVGHYFGLLHYFENERCDGLGDMVDDTPTSKSATYACSERVDSCPHQPGLDPIHNIMGYAEDVCLVNFTNGQLDRMSWILNIYKNNLTSIVYRPCSIDSVFRWSDGFIYFFLGKSYYLYDETTQSIDPGYPRPINDHWRGVPNNIDGVFRYSDDITYFFKGSDYYRFNDVTRRVDSGYPKKISEFWNGIPNDVDDVIKYNNGYTYFFKNSKYYRFNSKSQSVDVGYPKQIENYWTGIPENIDAALTWYNGEAYFFKDDNFWHSQVQNIDHNLIEQPYPKSIKVWWNNAQHFTGYSVFRECRWRTYFVSGDKYWEYNYQSQSVDLFSPRPLWNGMPSKIDAMFVWSNNYLYVFSGQDYYLCDTKTKALIQGYPQKIASFWKGVPNNIDAVFRSSNGLTYFFKGTHYYRFNDRTLQVDTSYPKRINEYWKGVPSDLDTVFYSPDGHTYFFKGNNYYRFNFTKGAVDDGYPRHVAEAWRGMLYKP